MATRKTTRKVTGKSPISKNKSKDRDSNFLVMSFPEDSFLLHQSDAAANLGDCSHRQIWGPNVNNNIYILIYEYSSIVFE